MHAVIRHYRGNSQLFDELERRTDEVETLIRGVAGFVSYYLVRTEDGGRVQRQRLRRQDGDGRVHPRGSGLG